jgi:hypothetical protein
MSVMLFKTFKQLNNFVFSMKKLQSWHLGKQEYELKAVHRHFTRVVGSAVIGSVTFHSEDRRRPPVAEVSMRERADINTTFRGPIHLQIFTVNGLASFQFCYLGTCRFCKEERRRRKVHSRRAALPRWSSRWDIWETKRKSKWVRETFEQLGILEKCLNTETLMTML